MNVFSYTKLCLIKFKSFIKFKYYNYQNNYDKPISSIQIDKV